MYPQRNRKDMSKTQKNASQETRKVSLSGLFDKVLIRLDMELDKLPETLESVTPEKRLEFISRTLPILQKFSESGLGSTWDSPWGE